MYQYQISSKHLNDTKLCNCGKHNIIGLNMLITVDFVNCQLFICKLCCKELVSLVEQQLFNNMYILFLRLVKMELLSLIVSPISIVLLHFQEKISNLLRHTGLMLISEKQVKCFIVRPLILISLLEHPVK